MVNQEECRKKITAFSKYYLHIHLEEQWKTKKPRVSISSPRDSNYMTVASPLKQSIQ
jgi:hypothetical protein